LPRGQKKKQEAAEYGGGGGGVHHVVEKVKYWDSNQADEDVQGKKKKGREKTDGGKEPPNCRNASIGRINKTTFWGRIPGWGGFGPAAAWGKVWNRRNTPPTNREGKRVEATLI